MEIRVNTNQKQNGFASANAGWPGAERREAERSDAERSGAPGQPAASSASGAAQSGGRSDARRRTFSLDYKLGILKKAEALKATGGIAALLRREGLYSSHLTTWRQEREAGMRQGLTPKSRGPKQKPDSHKEELQKLQREILRLTDALARAEMIIDVQKSGLAAGMGPAAGPGGEDLILDTVVSLSAAIGIEAACDALAVPRATFYRKRPVLGPLAMLESSPPPPPVVRASPARTLGTEERQRVLSVLHEERFQDWAPAAVQATLLDEGNYLCSTRTMYRILEKEGETRERRDQAVHPVYQKPELLATAPNQLWSWDITKLRGPVKWNYFQLYVILDVFSRYVTGWMVAERESAELAKTFIEESIQKHEIPMGQLTIHADRGKSCALNPLRS